MLRLSHHLLTCLCRQETLQATSLRGEPIDLSAGLSFS